MAAYVEIIFDNTDGRLQVDGDEVVLRRTIGHKKDEFFVNRKRVQKTEVQSILESAGFSKSNPYYIVQQGKVANLCVMKDTDRLSLLKDIAGTTVYEERRTESLRIMQDTTNKQDRISEVLAFIDERLTELEKEKEELTEYDSLDKQRRALEYTLYDKELVKASEQLSGIEATRESEREKHQEIFAKQQNIQDEVQQLDEQMVSLRVSLERATNRKDVKVQELKDVRIRRQDLEVGVQEAEASSKASAFERETFLVELGDIRQSVILAESELALVEPQFDSIYEQQVNVEETLENIHSRVEQLYGKQGRGRQFNSKEERDTFLQSQIDILTSQINTKNDFVKVGTSAVEKEHSRLSKEKDQLRKAEAENTDRSRKYETLSNDIAEATINRNELQERRKTSWRELENCQEQLSDAQHDLDRGRQQLNSALPRAIAQGLVAVEQIAREKKLEGYYGPLINNFSLKNDAFRTAVEVAAGNSLFHVIVDTDATASMLMKELDRRKAGRLTFLPLNRIIADTVTYPESTDVRSMIDVALTFEPQFEIAMRHVFGKKLLARDLDVAAHFSKEYNLDAITREGDSVNRRGGFEGGFHDDRVSKIGAVIRISNATQRIDTLNIEEKEIKTNTDQMEVLVSDAMKELQRIEGEKEHTRSQLEQFRKELLNRTRALETTNSSIASRSDGLNAITKEVTSLQQQIDFYYEEMRSPMKDKLDDHERKQLDILTEKERVLQGELEGLQRRLGDVRTRRETLKADLKNNLLKRRAEVEISLASSSTEANATVDALAAGRGQSDSAAELARFKLELQHVVSILKTTETERDEADAQVETRKLETTAVEKQIENVRIQEQKVLRSINEASKMHDKLLNRRSMLMETVLAKQKLIRELGTLPRAELEGAKSMNEKELLTQLTATQEQLKKFAGVNRKALDQYVSFNEQRQTLLDRKGTLEGESQSIQKLVDSLDVQKEEAILRTFRGVSTHFSKVFSELVKGGKGQLIMRTSNDEEDFEGGEELAELSEDEETDGESNSDEEEEEEEEEEGLKQTKNSSKKKKKGSKAKVAAVNKQKSEKEKIKARNFVATFQGVQVRVSFSGAGQSYEMKQLSGGQKALVALALIFAIQRCDPAPFYLFDEIDQALDANYRAEVARLIERQANNKDSPTQFITTTFRPEMVQVAHRHYGIALVNKMSNIYPLNRADAESFVNDLMHEEEAVGDVTNVATYDKSHNKETTASSRNAQEHTKSDKSNMNRNVSTNQKEVLGDESDEDEYEGEPQYEGGNEYGALGEVEDDDNDNEDNTDDKILSKKQKDWRDLESVSQEIGVTLEDEDEDEDEDDNESESDEDDPFSDAALKTKTTKGTKSTTKPISKQVQGVRRKSRISSE